MLSVILPILTISKKREKEKEGGVSMSNPEKVLILEIRKNGLVQRGKED